MKTLIILECRCCGGNYYIGKNKITLHPGTETRLPDEIYIVPRKVARCTACLEKEDRTKGGRRKRFER